MGEANALVGISVGLRFVRSVVTMVTGQHACIPRIDIIPGRGVRICRGRVVIQRLSHFVCLSETWKKRSLFWFITTPSRGSVPWYIASTWRIALKAQVIRKYYDYLGFVVISVAMGAYS